MLKNLVIMAIACASLQAQVAEAPAATSATQFAVNPNQSVNPVIEWNRTLLVIVRTKGAQPPTMHSTRSFAILHAAIYDSVNNIVGQFTPYLVRLADVSPQTSQAAAADQAAHDVLVSLYPTFRTTLDAELQHDLAHIPDGKPKTDGIAVGRWLLRFWHFAPTTVRMLPFPPSKQKISWATIGQLHLISAPPTSRTGVMSLLLQSSMRANSFQRHLRR